MNLAIQIAILDHDTSFDIGFAGITRVGPGIGLGQEGRVQHWASRNAEPGGALVPSTEESEKG